MSPLRRRGPFAWPLLVVAVVMLLVPLPVRAQGKAKAAGCAQPLTTLTVQANTYAEVQAAPFERRVFVYAPAITAAGSGFRPFQIWVIEGLYGRPFVRQTGALSHADFEKLRGSPNVRATAIRVVRGDGSEGLALRMGRNTYPVQVLSVSTRGSGTVQVRFCR